MTVPQLQLVFARHYENAYSNILKNLQPQKKENIQI